MCLVVYLGLDGPLVGYSSPAEGEFGLEPEPMTIPRRLGARQTVYGVAQFGAAKWCCSCDLYFQHLPWTDENPGENTLIAYGFLRHVLAEADGNKLDPILFSCWSGEEHSPLVAEWNLPIEGFVPENNLFEEYQVTGGGLPPPSLFKISKLFDAPQVRYLIQDS